MATPKPRKNWTLPTFIGNYNTRRKLKNRSSEKLNIPLEEDREQNTIGSYIGSGMRQGIELQSVLDRDELTEYLKKLLPNESDTFRSKVIHEALRFEYHLSKQQHLPTKGERTEALSRLKKRVISLEKELAQIDPLAWGDVVMAYNSTENPSPIPVDERVNLREWLKGLDTFSKATDTAIKRNKNLKLSDTWPHREFIESLVRIFKDFDVPISKYEKAPLVRFGKKVIRETKAKDIDFLKMLSQVLNSKENN